MDLKLEILKKLLQKKNEGIPKSEFGRRKVVTNSIGELIRSKFIKERKVGRRKYLFITERGEIKFIELATKEDKLEIVINKLDDVKKTLEENMQLIEDLLKSIRNTKIKKKIDINKEIYRVYKDLSEGTYSYLRNLVPIPSITAQLVNKFDLTPEEIHKAIYELYLKGEVSFEMGDKKEGNLVTPEGKKYYYLRFKK